ncbi:MAG TPA: chitobiase/beta-hexosaminidase C-terminal domain-containing protein [Bryobacteraceae bacterium]|nr:chitobiase/beta-hexosaminidase C-terminal domain-containing protein [Bryobacteraceae bacterium]
MRTIWRRGFLQWLAGWAGAVKAQENAPPSDTSDALYRIQSHNLVAELSAQGRILRLRLGPQAVEIPFRAGTVLADCQTDGAVRHSAIGKGAEFIRPLIHEPTGQRCEVIERFQPAETSVRWTVEIRASGEPWTTPIETQAALLNPSKARFWTTWDNPPDAGPGWNDPLTPSRFSSRTYRYGVASLKDSRNHPAFCIPICTIIDARAGFGFSLVQSPQDVLLDLELHTTELGDLSLIRKNHRIGGGRAVRFDLDLLCHAPDWRAGLGWMVRRYPEFFEPANSVAYELDGCGAYSAYQGDLDISKYSRMAFSVNWNAHFDFPYEGMFVPPVAPRESWTSWYGEQSSLARMRAYDRRMQQAGFHVLEYFCATDAGNFIDAKAPPRKAKLDYDLWRDPNDFIHYQIPSAVVRERDGKIRFSNWFRCVNVDPGEPVWQQILLAQARRMVQYLQKSSGICIDRMDWLSTYNPNRDDGVSWIDGRPARSLLVSWKDLLSKLGPILHQANKCIYGNPGTKRLDANAHLDGFYDEFADFPNVLNLSALLGVCRPVIGWTRNLNTLRPDPDELFQRHLHMGVFPTVPFPGNDHTILPDSWADRYYLDYGPLFDAMRGKKWVLRANPVSIPDGRAKANIFEVPGGFAVPVTFGGELPEVSIVLKDLPRLPGQQSFLVRVRHPGAPDWASVAARDRGDSLAIQCTLKRGCAMLTLLHSWIFVKPSSQPKAELGTLVKGAAVHYTLDGTTPTPASPLYSSPLVLIQPATIKMIVTVGGQQVGGMLWRRAVAE